MRRVGTWLAWWAVLFAFWLVLTFTPVISELVVGAAAAAIAATAAELVWHQRLIGFRPRLSWVLRIHRLPREIVRDTLTVFAVLFRQVTRRREMRGAWRAIPIDAGGDEPRSATRLRLDRCGNSARPNARGCARLAVAPPPAGLGPGGRGAYRARGRWVAPPALRSRR